VKCKLSGNSRYYQAGVGEGREDKQKRPPAVVRQALGRRDVRMLGLPDAAPAQDRRDTRKSDAEQQQGRWFGRIQLDIVKTGIART
jgi:hypothetical protein